MHRRIFDNPICPGVPRGSRPPSVTLARQELLYFLVLLLGVLAPGAALAQVNGGPNSFGYEYESTPYDFVSPPGNPSSGPTMDNMAVSLALPWAFDWYSSTHNQVTIHDNGTVGFQSGAQGGFDNMCLPSMMFAPPEIGVYWDDLNVELGGSIEAWHDTTGSNDRYIISWTDIASAGSMSSGGGSFQIHLEPSGAVEMHWDDTDFGDNIYDDGASATIFIDDGWGGDPLQFSCNSSQSLEGTAIRFSVCPDADGDSYLSDVCGGADCDDSNPSINPAAVEIPDDGIDQDCSGSDSVTCLADNDGDGWGSSTTLLSADADCADMGEAELSNSGDCDDTNSSMFPGAPEVPDDGIDQDCDGTDATTCFEDDDGDSFGSSTTLIAGDGNCTDLGESTNNADCDDSDVAVNPSATEVCDGVDNNCDGATDENQTFTDYYPDEDDDSFGDQAATPTPACAPVTGMVADNSDCDDDITVNPSAPEVCNGEDDDCDGATDDGLELVDQYPDVDGDGFGADGASPTSLCVPTLGMVTDHTDCDDGDSSINPGATEICNGTDDDCSPLNDEVTDYDEDGFSLCGGDCSEGDPTVYPGAFELCDGLDNDCDPATEEDETDGDGDGSRICDQDCDDTNADIHPGGDLLCDGLDNDCDSQTAEPDDVDGDGDGARVCDGDCDDGNDAVHPGATEVCEDSIDQDCNGAESFLGIDPRCLAESRLGCSSSLSGLPGTASPLAFLGVCLGLIGFIRRRQRPGRSPDSHHRASLHLTLLLMLPAVLLVPTDGMSTEVRSAALIRVDIDAGRCSFARLEARARVAANPASAEDYKLLGDAARCSNDPREALLSYRSYIELGGQDSTVSRMLPSLSSLLATVSVTAPAMDDRVPPTLAVEMADDVATASLDSSGSWNLSDIRTNVPVVLTVQGAGWAASRTPLEALASGEVRTVNLALEWVGFGKVAVATFEEDALDAVWLSAAGPVPLAPKSSLDVTAGELSFQVVNSMGSQDVRLAVSQGATLQFDPTSWAAAELKISGVPAGSDVRVFVEGHDGTFMEREGHADAAGETDEESGVIVAPSLVLQSLVGGVGGLFVKHPQLGEGLGQVVLAPGTSNSATFVWQDMPGVPGVRSAWTSWRDLRARNEALHKKATISGLAMTVGAGIASAIFWGLAASSSAAADQARTDTVLAGDRGDLEGMQSAFDRHQSAMAEELGFAVSGGIAAGLSGVGLGLTLTFDSVGKKRTADQGEWSMADIPSGDL